MSRMIQIIIEFVGGRNRSTFIPLEEEEIAEIREKNDISDKYIIAICNSITMENSTIESIHDIAVYCDGGNKPPIYCDQTVDRLKGL